MRIYKHKKDPYILLEGYHNEFCRIYHKYNGFSMRQLYIKIAQLPTSSYSWLFLSLLYLCYREKHRKSAGILVPIYNSNFDLLFEINL